MTEELYKVIPKKDYKYIEGLAFNIYIKSFAYISKEDLIQEGVLAYLAEKKKYDSTKNDYFMGYAYKRIRGAMLDYVARNSVDKYKTVRKAKDRTTKESCIVPAPENVEMYHISNEEVDELLEEMHREEVYEIFQEYLESLTELEKVILYGYFVEGKSMLQIGKEVQVGRLKIKLILVNCVNFLKRKLDSAGASGEVDLKSISRWDGKHKIDRERI